MSDKNNKHMYFIAILTLIGNCLVAFMPHIVNAIIRYADVRNAQFTQSNAAEKICLDVKTRVKVITCDLQVRLQPNTSSKKILTRKKQLTLEKGFTGEVIKVKPPENVYVDCNYEWRRIKWEDGTTGWSAIRDKANNRNWIIECE